MDEISINQALQELDTTLADLLQQSKTLSLSEDSSGISCRHHWNPEAKTFSYHTHVVVPHIHSESLETLSHLFFNAYSLQRHGWYSQFVSGTIKPLPFHTDARGEHQLGLGYF
jgi:Co/Zn/Cd efflux system component